MKVIKIEVYVETNRVGSRNSEVLSVEVDDDATKKDISDACDEVCQNWMFEHIVYGWAPKEVKV